MDDETLVGLQRVRHSEFKANQADTYGAANRAPVVLVRRRGQATKACAAPTHVLLSVAEYARLVRASQP